MLPLVLDVCWGSKSNMAAILRHLHDHQNEGKPFLCSVAYFLQYAAYRPYQAGRVDFGRYAARGLGTYLRVHWFLYLGWLLVTALVSSHLTATRKF